MDGQIPNLEEDDLREQCKEESRPRCFSVGVPAPILQGKRDQSQNCDQWMGPLRFTKHDQNVATMLPQIVSMIGGLVCNSSLWALLRRSRNTKCYTARLAWKRGFAAASSAVDHPLHQGRNTCT